MSVRLLSIASKFVKDEPVSLHLIEHVRTRLELKLNLDRDIRINSAH